ncbi:MAG: phosphonate ABC transporter, permease protein PhnE [Burkholderiaceae bacterium]
MSLRDTPPAVRAPLGGSEVHVVTSVGATNEKFRLPPPLFDARCKACWFVFGLVCLTVASFWTLELKWAQFFSVDAARKMGKFINELLVPETEAKFMAKLVWAALETLAMSALGTLLAVVMGLALALPASKAYVGDPARWRGITRLLLNALRSIPELVWAALLLISAGLGPFAGTLALALHTTGVLGRLFAEALENAPAGPATALRTHGVPEGRVFWYATLPQVLPQLLSYSLYRWENNIRAAAVLGVVGAGGLGQMLAFHMGLFQMGETSSILISMMLLVAIVDAVSYWARRGMMR